MNCGGFASLHPPYRFGGLFADPERREEAVGNLKKAEAVCLEMNAPWSYWLTRAREALACITS